MEYKNILLPPDMRKEAYQFIKNIIDELESTGQLSRKDEGCFYILCETWNTYLEALDIQKKDGLIAISSAGNQSISPAVKIAKESKTTVLRTLLEMGLSLRSRKNLAVLDNKGASEEDSPLLDLIKKYNSD